MDAVIEYEGTKVTFYDIDPNSHMGNCLLKVCWYELPNLEFIRSLNVEGNYVDVGAFIGTHALYFSLFCKSKIVYAFEPKKDSFKKLMRNLRDNGAWNCMVFQTALVEASGVTLPIDEGELWETATLDSFAFKDVKVLKIDVEAGGELRVLQGAKETLKTVEHLFAEIWIPEVCAERHLEYPLPAMTELLKPYGLEPQGELAWENLWYFSKTDHKADVAALWRKHHG